METNQILGIARKPRAGAEMEQMNAAGITVELGVEGDMRGILRPNRPNLRQVTLLAVTDWYDACAEVDADLHWTLRRANILTALPLPCTIGTTITVGDAVLEITGQCDPCRRMDRIAQGCARR